MKTEELPADWFDPQAVMRTVLEAELNHWVPGASQRLIYRAGTHLGVAMQEPGIPDCGPTPGQHALTPDWAAGVYVLRCVLCARLYRH